MKRLGIGIGGALFILGVWLCFAIGLHAPDQAQLWIGKLVGVVLAAIVLVPLCAAVIYRLIKGW